MTAVTVSVLSPNNFSYNTGNKTYGINRIISSDNAIPRAAGLSAYRPHSEVGSSRCRLDAAIPSNNWRSR